MMYIKGSISHTVEVVLHFQLYALSHIMRTFFYSRLLKALKDKVYNCDHRQPNILFNRHIQTNNLTWMEVSKVYFNLGDMENVQFSFELSNVKHYDVNQEKHTSYFNQVDCFLIYDSFYPLLNVCMFCRSIHGKSFHMPT